MARDAALTTASSRHNGPSQRTLWWPAVLPWGPLVEPWSHAVLGTYLWPRVIKVPWVKPRSGAQRSYGIVLEVAQPLWALLTHHQTITESSYNHNTTTTTPTHAQHLHHHTCPTPPSSSAWHKHADVYYEAVCAFPSLPLTWIQTLSSPTSSNSLILPCCSSLHPSLSPPSQVFTHTSITYTRVDLGVQSTTKHFPFSICPCGTERAAHTRLPSQTPSPHLPYQTHLLLILQQVLHPTPLRSSLTLIMSRTSQNTTEQHTASAAIHAASY